MAPKIAKTKENQLLMNAIAQKEDQTVHPQPVTLDREYVAPQVNIFESKDGYVLEAEMPGVTKDGLNISLEGNVLTLLGHRPDGAVANAQLLYRESRPVDFRRVFEVDPSIETAQISAKMDQGILTLTLPKAEKVKPRKIAVS
jgi:HSP20 family protein